MEEKSKLGGVLRMIAVVVIIALAFVAYSAFGGGSGFAGARDWASGFGRGGSRGPYDESFYRRGGDDMEYDHLRERQGSYDRAAQWRNSYHREPLQGARSKEDLQEQRAWDERHDAARAWMHR